MADNGAFPIYSRPNGFDDGAFPIFGLLGPPAPEINSVDALYNKFGVGFDLTSSMSNKFKVLISTETRQGIIFKDKSKLIEQAGVINNGRFN
jgi:hypothetical protein